MADARPTGYDVRAHLPAGRILDRPTHDALVAAWATVGYRVMTSTEIEAIVGAPLPTATIKRLPQECF